jgi:hypothetical protein
MSQPPGPPYQAPPVPQSAPPTQPLPPAKKPKRFGWPTLIITAVVSLFVGILFASAGEPTTPTSTVTEAGPVERSEIGSNPGEPTEEPTQEPAPTEYTPKKSDWALKIKTTDKQCFGSAGCNVTVKITPQYAGASRDALPDEGTIDITYKVTGDESGPITGTATAQLADGTVDTPEESLSTRSSGTKITATVTDVEYNEFG